MRAPLCEFISSQGISDNKLPASRNHYHLLHGTVPNAKMQYHLTNSHPSGFCGERIAFLLVAFLVDRFEAYQ
jgi:hypothetical protein